MTHVNENDCDLSNVILQINNNTNDQNVHEHHKQPSRILHFSDGDLVEYSDDEADSPPKLQKIEMNPKSLGWLPWTLYQTSWAGGKLLEGCDYVGEALADFFGITTPKYQLEIEEYKRQKMEEAAERLKNEQEYKGWVSTNQPDVITMEEIQNTQK